MLRYIYECLGLCVQLGYLDLLKNPILKKVILLYETSKDKCYIKIRIYEEISKVTKLITFFSK